MKLKTLKDLDLGYEGYAPEDERIREELRAEAIKWVKWYEKMGTPKLKQRGYGLIVFFNITEEDLK